MSSIFTAKPGKEGLLGTLGHTITHIIPWHLIALAGISGLTAITLALAIAGPLLVRKMRNPLK
jgi:hypothetical protein